jgi:hypothetical protein
MTPHRHARWTYGSIRRLNRLVPPHADDLPHRRSASLGAAQNRRMVREKIAAMRICTPYVKP